MIGMFLWEVLVGPGVFFGLLAIWYLASRSG